jgi:4-hydroxy-3-methylbut-2-enyl diphosphate reductase IspH
MELKIEIDPKSGFCYGVVRAIDQAESYKSGEDAEKSDSS